MRSTPGRFGYGVVAFLLLLGAGQAEARAQDQRALDLLSSFNSRKLGAPGLRRVRLELVSDGQVVRWFETVHAWYETPTGVRSLVLLERPENLRGTSYLLVENEGDGAGVDVFLFLLAGKRRVLQIQPGRFDEGLLGSDFSYVDLLWRIPTRGRRFVYQGKRRFAGRLGESVDLIPESAEALASSAWSRVRYYFDESSGLLIGAEYFAESASGEKQASKVLAVTGWRIVEGVWAPSVMTMVLGEGRSSRLTLLSQAVDQEGFDPNWFFPGALAKLGAALVEGSLPPALAKDSR